MFLEIDKSCYNWSKLQDSSIRNWQIYQAKNQWDIVEHHSSHQLDLGVFYWVFQPIKAEYTFFSSSYGRVTKTTFFFFFFYEQDYILSHNLNIYKRMEIIQRVLWDQNGIKLETSNRMVTRKSQNIWRLNKHTYK